MCSYILSSSVGQCDLSLMSGMCVTVSSQDAAMRPSWVGQRTGEETKKPHNCIHIGKVISAHLLTI